MNETGDKIESISNEMKNMDINFNSNEISQIVDEMKDKCEAMVTNNNSDNPFSLFPDSPLDPFRRDNDSEAEDSDEKIDKRSDGQRDESNNNTIKDIKDTPKEDSNYRPTFTIKAIENERTEPLKSIEEMTGLTLHGRPKQMKPRTEKWGESVGIVDERGRLKRIISLDELHNYMILETWTYRNESKIYCSIINERYPRFFDSTIDYLQRWRMRYNIFVDKVLADKTDNSLVHLGEIHLYFDLIPKFSTPYYVNNSFYSNPNDAEKPINSEAFQKIKAVFDNLRKSPTIFQLKFPIRLYLFHNTDKIFEKFRERYQEIMDESRSVNRKANIRKARKESTGPPVRGGMSRSDRDFGQSSRDFHQTGRQFQRSDRKFSEMGQGFAATERRGVDDIQRGFAQNRRGFGRRGERSFSATNRKTFNAKNMTEGRRRRNDSENSLDVTFEDTHERQRNGNKSNYGRPQKPINRSDRVVDTRMDPLRDNRGHNIGLKERNHRTNSQPMDSEVRRQNRETFKGKDYHFPTGYTPATGPLFSNSETMDNGSNRRKNSVNSCGQTTSFGRYPPHN